MTRAAVARAEAFTAEVAAHRARWRSERAGLLRRHRQAQAAAREADRADIHALEIDAEARGERLPMLLPAGVADSGSRLYLRQQDELAGFDREMDTETPQPTLWLWLWLSRLAIWRSPGQRAPTTLHGIPRPERGIHYQTWRGNWWSRIDHRWQRA